MKKKKIAVIGLKGLPAFGGAATVGENIIEQLKDKYDFTVYSTASHTNLKTGNYNGYKQIVFKKIRSNKLNTLYYYILSALHAVLFEKYSIIHLHHRDAAFITLILKLRYKVILTTHGTFEIREKWKKYSLYFRIQEYLFLRFANILTCVSKNEKRQINTNIKKNAIYIPNGINKIDVNAYVKDSDYIFFSAGRIIHSKGCDILMKALKVMNYQGSILIAGDIDQTMEYKNLILSLSKGLNVNFLGLIKHKELLLSYCKKAKLFIFPSSIEAMSIMLLEAASQKVPIIASGIIENKDIFNDDQVLYFDTDNVNDLAEKIEWALSNSSKMAKKADNAYQKLFRYYLWENISKKYANIYNEVAERNVNQQK